MRTLPRRTPGGTRSGMIIVSVLILVIVLGFASLAFLMFSISTRGEATAAVSRRQALYAAEAGIAEAAVFLAPDLGVDVPGVLGTEAAPIEAPGGRYWVTGLKAADGTYTLTATGRARLQTVTIETYWGSAKSLKDFAIYAGNKSGDATYTFDLGGTSSTADVVVGDVYVAGDLDVGGDASLKGDAYATGEITGTPPSGTENERTSPVTPPDLAAMNYAATADFVIDDSTSFDRNGRLPETDPRHIIVEDFRSDLATSRGFHFDNTNYFLGDPHENRDLNELSVSSDGNNKVYYVDGNLWIEPQGEKLSIANGPSEGTVITIVVKGNIYMSDYLLYDDVEKDGILFVALSDGESYTDLDGDNQFDVGEPILHDDGDGVYEGNAEGSGNVCFGDPNGGPLGDVSAFLYAENHFEDHVLDGTRGTPLPFSITGFMSAGEQVRINRSYGSGHAEMIVEYDSRLEDGRLVFPGFPGSGAAGGDAGLRGWRIVDGG